MDSTSPHPDRRGAWIALVYAIFLFSGASALVYQVVWTRSLALVFGSSHLAVTTVLAVFMGGLALGGQLFGRRIRASRRLLALYGILELGIAACALVFALLLRVYPAIYVPLARLVGPSPLGLTLVRVAFAVAVLIVPTTLMGGTLPVLSSFVSVRRRELGRRLSFLYGFNTLGAVAGAGVAGFVLLRYFSVTTSLAVAVGINVVLGVVSLWLNDRVRTALAADGGGGNGEEEAQRPPADDAAGAAVPMPRQRIVLWAIGGSGFCALGYEVLWTRVLSVVIGASVYGFTLMLMAFLSGIALGSAAFGAWRRSRAGRAHAAGDGARGPLIALGAVELAIGVAALAVTALLRSLPAHVVFLQELLAGPSTGSFAARQGVDFLLAVSYMFVPAFLMGMAFPLAGAIRAAQTGDIGRAVGETLAANTVGAILGSAVSGFLLVGALGIERSLQLLTLVNCSIGVLVLATAVGGRRATRATAAGFLAVVAAWLAAGDSLRLWDSRFFAVFQTNRPDKFSSVAKIRDELRDTEVLYYAEGSQAIVSSIRLLGGTQSFITNGRVEASDSPVDLACQYTLGHLPMLLHPLPEKVFVLGTGSGMTLGATSVHPSVTSLTLAEIEARVLGVARTFAALNHDVLENPKLNIVFNDGRNFLLTTRERYDVITADPVHPWFSGAGYLYTREYFDLAASRLRPGGIVSQWLPIYELDVDDLRSIVRTFHASFAHVLVWLTHYDAHLVGSNTPFAIDEAALAARLEEPAVHDDLSRVRMGSVEELLSYFVMGTRGAEAFARGGRLNTDDNLYLEFSAPRSIEDSRLMAENLEALVSHRESLLPYLKPGADEAARARQAAEGEARLATASAFDPVHAAALAGRLDAVDAPLLIPRFDAQFGDYARWQFLRAELERRAEQAPRMVRRANLAARTASGAPVQILLGAVARRRTDQIMTVEFVDGRDGRVLARHDLLGPDLEARTLELVATAMEEARSAYAELAAEAQREGEPAPPESRLLARLALAFETAFERADAGGRPAAGR